jgi:hypothetical protein
MKKLRISFEFMPLTFKTSNLFFHYLFLFLLPFLFLFLPSCSTTKKISTPTRSSNLSGSEFYKMAAAFNWKQRDSLAVLEILHGNLPSFLKKFKAVTVHFEEPLTGKKHTARFYVSPDYLSLGSDDDWARIHISPMAAQKIADSLNCFLPTTKMVDDIYHAASLKLEPVPLFAFRDSSPTMYHHHLIVEGQRKGRKGLIAGIQKDVVISGKLQNETRTGRVAIYGWHQLNGKPIQPLYTGHAASWVDYSQGIRLVYRKIRLDGKWVDFTRILSDPVLKNLLCNEEYCDFNKYPY